MIVGNGMIAKAFATFRDDPNVLVFASGVSNSLETDSQAFERERSLLTRVRNSYRKPLFVYFGTCSVDDPDRRQTPYVHHKLNMESLLEESGAPWLVLRLPLAIGPIRTGHTLAPFLYQRISQGQKFEVWEHATRYPIDVEDALWIAQRFICTRVLWNRRINIALRPYRILEFVHIMESIVGRRAVFDLVPKGQHYAIHCPEVESVARERDLSEGYLDRVLRKYFTTRSTGK